MLISMLLGVLVGAVLGLTGAGGGMLAVPALVVGMAWTMQQATPVALIAVAGGAAVGAIDGLRRKLVRYKAALLMAAAGVPVTSLGISVSHLLSQRVLMSLFACVMLLVATRMILQARKTGADHQDDDKKICHINTQTGRFVWTWPTAATLAGIGALTGFLSGLLGVGGGFVIVPLMRKFTNLSMQGTVATSLMVIALVSVGGAISSIAHGAIFPVDAAVQFSLATAIGMLIGRHLARKVSPRVVQMTFAAVLIVVCAGLMAKVTFFG